MWYVIAADKGAKLISGFAEEITPKEYKAVSYTHLRSLTAEQSLGRNRYDAQLDTVLAQQFRTCLLYTSRCV